jgi:hypothetical protein
MPPAAPTALCAAAIQTPDCPPPALCAPVAVSCRSAQDDLRAGSRVRIEGLQGAPEMNGRTGVLIGDFDRISGRWSVRVDADGARRACVGMFRPSNLKLAPSHNFSTEWLDDLGRVCPKNVDYAMQCPKGHALAPFDGSGEPPAQQPSDADVICRVCHGSTQRRLACDWLTCSVAGCCGGYAVCAACVTVLGSALQRAAACTDDFCMTVTHCASAAILCLHICSGCSHSCVLTPSVREYHWSI